MGTKRRHFGEVLSTHSRHRKYLKAYLSHRQAQTFDKSLIFENQVDYWKYFPPSHFYLFFNGISNVCASSSAECPSMFTLIFNQLDLHRIWGNQMWCVECVACVLELLMIPQLEIAQKRWPTIYEGTLWDAL